MIILSLHHCRYQDCLRLKIHEVRSLTAEQDGVEPVLITMATLAHQGGRIPGTSPWCTVMAATSTVGGVILKLASESTGTWPQTVRAILIASFPSPLHTSCMG